MHVETYAPVVASASARRVESRAEAEEVSAFLLRPGLFGTVLTSGEAAEFADNPAESIGKEDDGYWYCRGDDGRLDAVLGIRMHVSRSGIFEISAMAVRPGARGRGIGKGLLAFALRFVERSKGRGLLFDTSSDASYAPMRHLLAQMGFAQVGCFPDFYHPGEDAVWYFHPVRETANP